MAKLKSLRGAVGSYGRVAAGGIIEVSDADAEKLLKTRRFVRASAEDIAAAERAQQQFLKVGAVGATPGFAPMPEPPPNQDRLSAMIAGGQITEAKAKELVALQINISDDEIRSFIETEMAAAAKALEQGAEDLRLREEALADREKELEARENAHADAVEKQKKAFLDQAADLAARENTLAAAAGADAPKEGDAGGAAKAKEDAKGKASK
jgi:hypothetical protein